MSSHNQPHGIDQIATKSSTNMCDYDTHGRVRTIIASQPALPLQHEYGHAEHRFTPGDEIAVCFKLTDDINHIETFFHKYEELPGDYSCDALVRITYTDDYDRWDFYSEVLKTLSEQIEVLHG